MRIFIAIILSDALRERIGLSIERLKDGLGQNAIRWLNPYGIHLTLKFIGETPDHQVEEIKAVMAAIAEKTSRFDMRVCGLGCFPDFDRPRVVWIGLSEPSGELETLVKRLDAKLHKAGLQREKRQFHPHLTVGRVRKRASPSAVKLLGLEIESRSEIDLGLETVEQIALIESELRPNGAIYSVLSSHALGNLDR